MKKQLLLFATGVMTVVVLLEIIFRLLPVSTATRSGYYISPLVITYPANHCFTTSTGWDLKNAQHNCANNFGFLTRRNFVHDPKSIALIGDSFVEANMLPERQRLGTRLETLLTGRPVYALGGPGSSLLDYAERAKFAAERFGTRTFVFVLERGDIKQAICGSGNIHGPCLDATTFLPKTEIQPPPTLLKRILRESALAQYIFSQLRFDISKELSKLRGIPKKQNILLSQDLSKYASVKVVEHFFTQLSIIEGGRFLFLIDADRDHLLDKLSVEKDDLGILKTTIHEMNAIVIDPTPLFREFVADSKLILEIGPYDRHWNAITINLLAELIAKQLGTLARTDF